MYEITQNVTAKHGFPAYEVSNHAAVGAESRHNTLYWRYGDYIGIGPGAHGRVTQNGRRFATEAIRMPNAWLEAAERGNGDKVFEPLTRDNEASEFLLMGLRLYDGIDLVRYENLSGDALPAKKIQDLADMGMVTQNRNRLQVTAQGMMVLNAVIEHLLPDQT
jgi:oxygen-independent coproporphyrinogen-3 oxidase